MAGLSLERVTKRFPDGTTAVDQVELEIEDREFLVLVGPSGCGKSTTLRMIAGLETVTDGEIKISDRVVNHIAPKDRDISMVFQNYALYPHMSVYKNMSFGLYLRFGGGWLSRFWKRLTNPRLAAELYRQRSGVEQLVRETAKRLGIEDLLDRKPYQLSGGERQRVALGRAIVRKPVAFLFDEPLSNLDAKLRQQMRVELKRLHRDLKTTMIYVTHDQVEAMTLADRVAVMNKGKILQIGEPLDIYQQPANLFVARFFGSVPINLWRGTVTRQNLHITTGEQAPLKFESKTNDCRIIPETHSTAEVILGFRAEDVTVENNPELAHLNGTILAVDRLGDSAIVHLDTRSETTRGVGSGEVDSFLEQDEVVFARLPISSNVKAGQTLGLKIDPERVNWFDPKSGENLLKDKK